MPLQFVQQPPGWDPSSCIITMLVENMFSHMRRLCFQQGAWDWCNTSADSYIYWQDLHLVTASLHDPRSSALSRPTHPLTLLGSLSWHRVYNYIVLYKSRFQVGASGRGKAIPISYSHASCVCFVSTEQQ